MRRFSAAFLTVVAAACLAASAQADPSEYGIKSASASASLTQAGDHPDFVVDFELKTEPSGELPSTTAAATFDLPPGLLANPAAVPKCTAAQLIATDVEDPSNATGCPQDSQVGVTEVQLFGPEGGGLSGFTEPIFNLEPGNGEPARFGFIADVFPVFIETELNPGREYAATAKVEGLSSLIPLLSANSTFWGAPAAESHDSQRVTAYEAVHNGGVPETPSGKRSSGLVPVPLMLNPTRCGVAQGVHITATPYALPSLHSEVFAPLDPNTGCGVLDFKPSISIAPTTTESETGSGLDVSLTFPQEGFEHPNLLAEAAQKKVEVTLPEGVTVNPSQAAGGLDACTEAEFHAETASSGPGEGCPDASKVGNVTALSPLLPKAAEGAVYVATPHQNPFGSLIALYMVVKIPDRGVVVRLAGKVTLDPQTGQLTTTFDNIPQLPISSFNLHFREGPRAPLVMPSRCGTYQTISRFTPWFDPSKVVLRTSTFQITSGVEGGTCPGSPRPFRPSLEAGTTSNNAGSYSPLYMRLARRDGDLELTRFSSTLPDGLLPSIGGIPRCSDAAIEAAKSKSGSEELSSPSCPPSSGIGRVVSGAGVGSILTTVPGKVYLAGPFNGRPSSAVAIVPALAGPFDLGTVVVREAVTVDPETAQVMLDGTGSDPIPRILAGIPLRLREVKFYADRPSFFRNPTDCDPLSFNAELWGGDFPTSLSQRFQAANCSLRGFKPRISLKLRGGTNRGAFPSLRAVVRPRPGDANFAAAVVTLPHSAFLEQGHIRTICTRVQFAAHQCPAGSIYGHAQATSPLLDFPLKGPVYLRSSSHELPDLVIALKGSPDLPIEFNLVGRIDSVNGGIRSRFEAIPDVPASKLVLKMQGGKKGLIVNSTALCRHQHRAKARFVAQNARVRNFSPLVKTDCDRRGRHK